MDLQSAFHCQPADFTQVIGVAVGTVLNYLGNLYWTWGERGEETNGN